MTEPRRWDDCCPHCDKFILNMSMHHVDHDYATEFEMECPLCGLLIDVTVEPVPEFGLSKPEAATQRDIAKAEAAHDAEKEGDV